LVVSYVMVVCSDDLVIEFTNTVPIVAGDFIP
jgi:hypothetical protein